MNNDIKEIIEKLKGYDNYKYRNENGRSYKELEGWEIDLLLNSYTNLQEENKNKDDKIRKARMYCNAVIKEHNNGEYNVSTIDLAIKEHKENIENVLNILQGDDKE